MTAPRPSPYFASLLFCWSCRGSRPPVSAIQRLGRTRATAGWRGWRVCGRAVSSARHGGPIPQNCGHRGARSVSGAVDELYPVSAIVAVSIGSGVSGRGLCRGHICLERQTVVRQVHHVLTSLAAFAVTSWTFVHPAAGGDARYVSYCPALRFVRLW